jgi:hypothetical protein
MRFAHLKRLRLGRLRLRGPRGAQDEFVLAAMAQNLRRLAAVVARPAPSGSAHRVALELHRGRQGRRIKSRPLLTNGRPPIGSSRLLLQNRSTADFDRFSGDVR